MSRALTVPHFPHPGLVLIRGVVALYSPEAARAERIMNPAQEHSTIWLELRRLPQILFYVAAGRSNVARLGARGASGRMPLPRAGHPTARAVKASAPLKTAARRPLVVVVVVVVVVVAATPNYLRQASQNLGKYNKNQIYMGLSPPQMQFFCWGICPNPAANKSKVGYIPLFWHAQLCGFHSRRAVTYSTSYKGARAPFSDTSRAVLSVSRILV